MKTRAQTRSEADALSTTPAPSAAISKVGLTPTRTRARKSRSDALDNTAIKARSVEETMATQKAKVTRRGKKVPSQSTPQSTPQPSLPTAAIASPFQDNGPRPGGSGQDEALGSHYGVEPDEEPLLPAIQRIPRFTYGDTESSKIGQVSPGHTDVPLDVLMSAAAQIPEPRGSNAGSGSTPPKSRSPGTPSNVSFTDQNRATPIKVGPRKVFGTPSGDRRTSGTPTQTVPARPSDRRGSLLSGRTTSRTSASSSSSSAVPSPENRPVVPAAGTGDLSSVEEAESEEEEEEEENEDEPGEKDEDGEEGDESSVASQSSSDKEDVSSSHTGRSANSFRRRPIQHIPMSHYLMDAALGTVDWAWDLATAGFQHLRRLFWTITKYLAYLMLLVGLLLVVGTLGFGALIILKFLLTGAQSAAGNISVPSVPKIPLEGWIPSNSWTTKVKNVVKHPTTIFSGDVVRDIYDRLSNHDRQISSLASRQVLHSSTLETLNDILPSKIAGSRKEGGKVVYPDDFWAGLRSKISASGAQESSGSTSDWDSFLKRNKVRVEAFIDERSRYVSNEVVQTKFEAISELSKKFYDLRNDITHRVDELESKYRTIEDSVSRTASSVASSVARTAGGSRWSKHLPAAQLDALSQAVARIVSSNVPRKLDFLTAASGATIEPWLTSYTSVREKLGIKRVLSFFSNSPPRPVFMPEATQASWLDVGDCWCTPMTWDKNMPQIAYSLPYEVIPSGFTIEHIPRTATLQPGLAPRNIELWARVHNPEKRAQIASAGDELLGPNVRASDDAAEYGPTAELGTPFRNKLNPKTWVRVAHTKYDLQSINNVQTFGLLVDFEKLGATVHEVALRILDNWGNNPDTCLYRVRLHGTVPTSSPARELKLLGDNGDSVQFDDPGFGDDEVLL
ncbi:MAG: hypothetical protein M1814_001970 [Vezdaea aestivalis]|nr:MAG: hypothetical protein M1814_001970 [Vezdaea aestivalis]